jgi:septum formation protein
MKPLILASASPRRKEILKQLGIVFTCEPSSVEESGLDASPMQWPLLYAEMKAKDVSKSHPNSIVLGCDTLVFRDGVPLGKPKTPEDAYFLLQSLNGRSHQVRSGIAFAYGGEVIKSKIEETEVFFRNNDPQDLLDYVNSLEPMDKAGAYGIQGRGASLVKSISGCYYNVVGLPVASTLDLFKEVNNILCP